MSSATALKPKTSWTSHLALPWAVGVFLVMAILLKAWLSGKLGHIGIDSDDKLRYLQIWDYLQGQSWFDVDQYRMGLAGGTDMHWSRIPDIPIILLTHIFDLFTDQKTALRWAYTLWPPLSAMILLSALMIAARSWAKIKGVNWPVMRVITLVLASIYILSFFRFSPGAIDHHNIQMGLMVLAMALLLAPDGRFWRCFAGGVALAVSVAIGVEVYLFAAVTCAYVAINWVIRGKVVKTLTQGFSLGLVAGLWLCFLGTIAPPDYVKVACDSLSIVTVMAGTIGGLGLTFLAWIEKADRWAVRLVIMGLLFVPTFTVLAMQVPQCVANPLDALPDQVRDIWLGSVDEAQTIFGPDVQKLSEIPLMIGPPLVALIVLALGWVKREGKPFWNAEMLVVGLIAVALLLTLYQIRFYPFAYVFSIIPLAGWAAKKFVTGKEKDGGSVAYLGALAASIPFIWSVPGLILGGSAQLNADAAANAKAASCLSKDVIETLRELPKGAVLTNSDFAGPLMLATDHRYISGNYHRNWQGIALEIRAAISTPDTAYKYMVENDVDYLIYCGNGNGNQVLIDANDQGLFAQLSRGIVPRQLTPLNAGDPASGMPIIYRVTKP